MRLRALEIQGFKSFPDKTRLELGDGITAVVGPNGSGKSNIADAVRWALGEQSTKTLRGGRMEDVIFGGTQARGAIGFASVRIIIDNSDKTLPDRDDEITITRKLYRSGESEYMLNGASVRLRDINEMLMDTGLGRDGYSIIGQGRIAEIISARSRERREIFEEAAGIAKYRYRKAESEKRLEQAEENLVRLRDILGELEERVGPLKQQAEKAREFLSLADERKKLEVSLWMISLSELKERLAEQENRVDICKNEYERLERESEAAEEDINTAYGRSRELDVLAESTRARIKSLEERLGKCDAEAAVLGNDIFHNNSLIQRMDEDIAGAGTGGDILTASLNEKNARHSAEKAEISAMEARLTASEERLAGQREMLGRVNSEISGLEARSASLSEAASAIKLEQAAGASALTESLARLDAIKKNNAAHDSNIAALTEALEECGGRIAEQDEIIDGLSNSMKGYELKRESRAKRLEGLRGQVRGHEEEASRRLQRARLLEDLEKSMEGFSGSVRHILEQSSRGALSGVHGAVSSLVSVDEKYTLAIEVALGQAVQNIVVDDEDTAKRAIRMLQNARAGRGTFLPLTTVKGRAIDISGFKGQEGFVGIASGLVSYDRRYEGIIESILGRTVVAEDLDSGSQMARKNGFRARIVTLDGQLINAGGSYTGGSSARGTGMLGRRNEIARLSEEAAGFNEKARMLAPDIKSGTEELSALDAEISGASAELRTAREEKVRLEAQQESLKASFLSAGELRKLALKELEELTARLSGLESGGTEQKEVLARIEAQASELNEKLASARARLDMLSVGERDAAENINVQRMALLSAKKDLDSLEQDIARIQEQIETAGTRARGLEEEKAALVVKNIETAERIATIEQEKENIRASVGAGGEEVKSIAERRAAMEREITEIRQREREISSRKENVSKELARLEERRNAVQVEYDGIIMKLWDEYGLTRSQAAESAIEIPDRDKAAKRLAELRSRIRQLGTVNVDAIDEFAEVNERYTFLSGQVRDVEESREQLGKLIDELTEEMRGLFIESFADISGHFSTVFRQLFGGGKAELTLSNPSDPLESGVEIFVQPPGKVIKNLSLLSGGEQAFVAIAIYFAILKVKPAPFCLLDEIEAALDDVNVARFASYLRQMCVNTQFIAITHRRGTMEEADVLYGVTMQEEGVSKLLELKVAEVESRIGIKA